MITQFKKNTAIKILNSDPGTNAPILISNPKPNLKTNLNSNIFFFDNTKSRANFAKVNVRSKYKEAIIKYMHVHVLAHV